MLEFGGLSLLVSEIYTFYVPICVRHHLHLLYFTCERVMVPFVTLRTSLSLLHYPRVFTFQLFILYFFSLLGLLRLFLFIHIFFLFFLLFLFVFLFFLFWILIFYLWLILFYFFLSLCFFFLSFLLLLFLSFSWIYYFFAFLILFIILLLALISFFLFFFHTRFSLFLPCFFWATLLIVLLLN